MKDIISKGEISEAIKLKHLTNEGIATAIMNIFKINKLNDIYQLHKDKNSLDFIDAIIDELGIQFEINEKELDNIPDTGAFITVSNHPFGGIDGILLLKLLIQKRSDFRMLANFFLQRIEPLSKYFIPVNPFGKELVKKSSVAGIKEAIGLLKQQSPIGIFPAGEVSSFNKSKIIQDKKWEIAAIKFIKKAKVPVIPIYFHGSNSHIFHLLGLIHPLFRTAKLPSELFNKNKKVIKIRIGKAIDLETQNKFTDIEQYGRFLRAKTYALGVPMEVNNFFTKKFIKPSKQKKIIEAIPKHVLQKEIEAIKESALLVDLEKYQIFCAKPEQVPNILQEIGRLREVTFRAVGEGTNKSIDIDEFDLYYEHLFIWDKDDYEIVGAYRIGKGKNIIEQYGKKGFYISTLFRIKKVLKPMLSQSLELGRSFITKKYQKKPAPLFLLWKGILYFLLKNPEYRYLIGPVSISNDYSNVSKALIIDFIKKHYFNKEVAKYIKPRKKFKVKYKKADYRLLLDSTKGKIGELDQIIEEIEPNSSKIPVLLKKYLKLNAQILGFNVDTKFNNSLDGLIFLDLMNIPENMIKSLSKEFNDDTILNKFYTETGKI